MSCVTENHSQLSINISKNHIQKRSRKVCAWSPSQSACINLALLSYLVFTGPPWVYGVW